MTDWIANGPDGSELIGYLAGLGWLVLVGAGAPPGAAVTLRWERHAAGWRPRLTHPGTPDDGWRWLGDGLRAYARAFGAELPGPPVETVPVVLDPGWKNPKDARVPDWQARAAAVLAAGISGPPIARDVLAAIVSDVGVTGGGKDVPPCSQFCLVQGTAQQYFLAFARELLLWAETDPRRRLEATLSGPWRYAEEAQSESSGKPGMERAPSMWWDPRECRPHALLSRNPKGGRRQEDAHGGPKKPTEAGGSALAVAGLAAFPVLPRQGGSARRGAAAGAARRAYTLGWARVPGPGTDSDRKECFTWGLHECPLELEGVRALLRLPLLAQSVPNAAEASGRGIAEVRRVTTVKLSDYLAHVGQAWSLG